VDLSNDFNIWWINPPYESFFKEIIDRINNEIK